MFSKFQFLLFFLLFAFFIFLFILFRYNNNVIMEHYDARVSSIDQITCGNLCTKTIDCQAFAYDNVDNLCYLSKQPIFYQSPKSIYSQEYDVDQFRCNKIKPILSHHEYDQQDKINNTIYGCQKSEDADYQFYIYANDSLQTVEKKNNTIDTLTYDSFDLRSNNIKDYDMYKINWPNYRKDIVVEKVYNMDTNVNNKIIVYNKKTDLYDGDSLFDYDCVKNIPADICLQTCSAYNDCTGAEINPLYKNDRDICCLKKNILWSNVRNADNDKGSFYVKEFVDKIDNSSSYVKL